MSEPMTFQKKSRRERYIVRDDVVEATGLEPAASWSQTKHSTKLSYASNSIYDYNFNKLFCQPKTHFKKIIIY